MSLKELVAEQRKNTSSHSSGKNPAYYSKQRQLFVDAMCNHTNPMVRAAAYSNQYVPTKMLSEAASNEEDSAVLKAIIMNDRLPQKALEDFAKSDTADQFEADADVNDHVRDRFGLVAPEPASELGEAAPDAIFADDDEE